MNNAPKNVINASETGPARFDLKCVSAATLMLGATKPPMLPNELIIAIPAAALAPDKYPVGNVQKSGWTAIYPDAATQRARSAMPASLRGTARMAHPDATSPRLARRRWLLYRSASAGKPEGRDDRKYPRNRRYQSYFRSHLLPENRGHLGRQVKNDSIHACLDQKVRHRKIQHARTSQ